ncbi:MAG: hypothetical protein K8R54_06675 [Bacteroidales bacterium]|nr:hypothetical protein [Bacteroidales bacterium]
MILKDRKFTIPRNWSNTELKKVSSFFRGKVVNVSGWQDKDKEGDYYKNYFTSAEEYHLTNYISEARGFQGDIKNEIFLDLEKDLPENLIKKFDVVFNHTTLEHVFNIFKAFENLCKLSKDIVIVILPFIQEVHGEYGDYWRITPQAVNKLFIQNSFSLIYLNFSQISRNSTYIFAVGTKNFDKWKKIENINGNKINNIGFPVGNKHIKNSFIYNTELFFRKNIEKFLLKKKKHQ